MSTYIGFNLNSNRQIEHFQTIENRLASIQMAANFFSGRQNWP